MKCFLYQSKVIMILSTSVMILLIISIIPTLGFSQFSIVTSSIQDVNVSATTWGDHDNNAVSDILMVGNVYEWCWDVYLSRLPCRASDLKGALKGDYRVVIADSWFDTQIFCPVSQRILTNNEPFDFNNVLA